MGTEHDLLEPDGAYTQYPLPPMMTEPFLFTPEEAAALLRMEPGWLRRKAASRLVPCTVLGRTVRFSRMDLDKLITACAQPVRNPDHDPHTA